MKAGYYMQDDYGNVTLVNVSGIYDEQPLFIDKLKKGGAGVIDAVSMTGTNGYCDDMAKEKFREMMKEYPTKGIHFIDGGNYHYLTLLWLSLIDEPFDLIVFDNHSDMQKPAFGDVLSCGGWIRNLVEDSGFKGKVTVVGVDKDNIDKEMKELGVKFITKQTILKKRGQQYGLENELIDKCWTGKRPVYISVDKDVLDEKEYKTNWNQGIMSVDELFAIIEDTFEMRKVIGMDICGEMDEAVNSEFGSIYNEIHQAVNMRFLKFRIS